MANVYYVRVLLSNAVFIILLTNSVISSSTPTSTSSDTWSSIVPRELKVVMDSCMSRTDKGYCLQRKMVDFLDRALVKDSITLTDGLSIDKSKDAINISDSRQQRQQAGSISEILWDRLQRFYNSRVISINLAEAEGRGKKKKEGEYYAVAIATAVAVLIPLTLKGLAIIAGSALLIAKVALVLAGLAALKHFVNGNQGGDNSSHRRIHIEDRPEAHNLAYSAYATQ
ncbi:osiris 21 [Lycorma delicatula]|uniref:osiris 21 n=1 Tax=Lycorma delicatula TaxID=130591 RepID=UPI003F519AF2